MSHPDPSFARPTEGEHDPVSRWTRASEFLFVHESGARIERRGFPHPLGWFLVPAEAGWPALRFEPTPHGCDCAFVAISGRQVQMKSLQQPAVRTPEDAARLIPNR